MPTTPKIEGSLNIAPPGFREVTAEEFANSLPPWCVVATEYRQLRRDANDEPLPRMIDGTLHLFGDQTGFMIEHHYVRGNGYELKYYLFGCKHAFRELSRKEAGQRGIQHFGMCYHVYECTKCGYIQSIDSSD